MRARWPIITVIMLVSATALALPRNYRRLIHTLSDAAGAVAAFAATFGEPDHNAPDGTCSDADAMDHFDFGETSGNLTGECNSVSVVAAGDPTYSKTGPNNAGNAITLDGTGDYFETSGDTDTMDIGTEDFSFEFIVQANQVTAVSTLQYIMGKAELTSPFKGYYFYFNGGLINFRMNSAATNSFSDGNGCQGAWRDGSWGHYRVEVDRDSEIFWYHNGAECSTGGKTAVNADSQLTLANTQSFFLGGQDNTFTGLFNGHFADYISCKGTLSDCPSRYDNTLTDTVGGATPTVARTTLATGVSASIGQPIYYSKAQIAFSVPMSNGDALPTGGEAMGAVFTEYNTIYRLRANDDLTNATYWTETGTSVVTADQVNDPRGWLTADQVSDDDGAGVEKVCQSVTVTASQPHSASMLYKNASGTPTPVLELDGTQTTCDASDSTWQLCTVGDASSSGTSIDLCIYPAGTTAASTGDIYVWRPQVKDTSVFYWPEFHRTTTGAVVVGGDDLTYSSVSAPDEGVFSGWVYVNGFDSDLKTIMKWNGTHDMFFGFDSSGQPAFRTTGLGDNADATASVAISTGTWQHICAEVTQSGANIDLFIDGSEVALGTSDFSFTAGGTYGTTLDVGQDSATGGDRESIDGVLADVRMYNTYVAGTCASIYAETSATYAHAPVERGWMYALAQPFRKKAKPTFHAPLNTGPLEGLFQ